MNASKPHRTTTPVGTNGAVRSSVAASALASPEVAELRRAQDRMFERYGVDAESQFVDVAALGGTAHVSVAGEGPPVVMVIGGGMVGAMWAPLMAELSGFTLYAVDLPGHGLSDSTEYRTATLRRTAVTFLGELLDGLSLERAPFVAQSMGGLWSSWFALERPDRVTVLSLIGCPALILDTSAPVPMRISTIKPIRRLLERLQPPSPSQVDRLAAMAGEDFTDTPELRDLFVAYERLPGSSEQLLTMHRAALRLRGARPEVQLDAGELAGLSQPVQLIWGDRDPFGSPEVGRRVAEVIPDAEFHCVETGHGPWFSEAAEIGPLVTSFLGRHSPRERAHDHPTEGDQPRTWGTTT